MASVKLAAAALAAVLLVCAAATTATATAYGGYHQPQPQPLHEDCKTQAAYFKNCLSYGLRKSCCAAHVVVDPVCYCEVEREAVVECAHGKKNCHGIAGIVKVRHIKDLPCLENLHCKHA